MTLFSAFRATIVLILSLQLCVDPVLKSAMAVSDQALAPRSQIRAIEEEIENSGHQNPSGAGYVGQGLEEPLAKRWIAEMLKQGALFFDPDGKNPRWGTLGSDGIIRHRLLTPKEEEKYRKLIDNVAKASNPEIVRRVIRAIKQPSLKDFDKRKEELFAQRMRATQVFFPQHLTVAGGYWEHGASEYQDRLYAGGKLAEKVSPEMLAWTSLQGSLHHVWKDAKHKKIAHEGPWMMAIGRTLHAFKAAMRKEKQEAKKIAVESLRRLLQGTDGVVFRGMGYLHRSRALVKDVGDGQVRPVPASSTAVLIVGDEAFILPGTDMEKVKHHVPEKIRVAIEREAQAKKISTPDVYWVSHDVLKSRKNRELRRTLRGDISAGYMDTPRPVSMLTKISRWSQRALQVFLTIALFGLALMPSVAPAQGLSPVPLAGTEQVTNHPLIGGQVDFAERRLTIVPIDSDEPNSVKADLGMLEPEKTYNGNLQVKDKDGKPFQILAVRNGYNVKTALWDEAKQMLTIVTDKYGAQHIGNDGDVTAYLMDSSGKWVELMLGLHFDESSAPPVKPPPNLPPRLTSVRGTPVQGQKPVGVEVLDIGDIVAGQEIAVPFEFMDPEGKAVTVELSGFDPLQSGDMTYAFYDADAKVMRWMPLPEILERIKKDKVNVDINVDLKDDLDRPFFSNTVLRIKANLISSRGSPEQTRAPHEAFEGMLHFSGQEIQIRHGHAHLGNILPFKIRQGRLSIMDAEGPVEILRVSKHPWLGFKDGVLTILPNEDTDVANGFTILVKDGQKNFREISVAFDVQRPANAAPQWTSVNGRPVSTGPMPTVDMGEIPHNRVMRLDLGFNDAEGDVVDLSVEGIIDSIGYGESGGADSHVVIGKNSITFFWIPGSPNLELAAKSGGTLTGMFMLDDKKGHAPVPLNLIFHFKIPERLSPKPATVTSTGPASVETMSVSTEAEVATTAVSAAAVPVSTQTFGSAHRLLLATNPLEIESVGGRSVGMVFDAAVGKPLELEVVVRGIEHNKPKFWVEQGVGKIIGSRGRVGTFSYTPTKPGTYPAVLTATDQMGNRTGVLVFITAKESLPLPNAQGLSTKAPQPAPIVPAAPDLFSWLWANLYDTPIQFVLFVLGGMGFVWGAYRYAAPKLQAWIQKRSQRGASPEMLAAENVLQSAVPIQELDIENMHAVQQYL